MALLYNKQQVEHIPNPPGLRFQNTWFHVYSNIPSCLVQICQKSVTKFTLNSVCVCVCVCAHAHASNVDLK